MDATLKVSDTAEATTLDANRKPVQIVRVQFYVGTHGPFYQDFPRANFDANAARQKLEDFARSITTLTR